MPKYLMSGSYTVEGLKGVIKDGGTKRVQAIKMAVESLGGKLESIYFAFGNEDFYFIVDGVSNVTTLAGCMMSNAIGTSKLKTTVLLTPEEVDQATKMTMDYRPPGQ